MRRFACVVSLALTVAALAQNPSPRQFRISTAVGTEYAYSFRMKMRMADGAGEVGMDAEVRERLMGNKSGALDWAMLWNVQNVSDSGMLKGVAPILKKLDKSVVRRMTDLANQTVKTSVGSKVSDSASGPNLVFPRKAIDVGESWKSPVDLNGNPAVMKFTFDGYGNYGNKPAAKFTGVFEPNPVVESIEPHTFFVDVKDGKLLDSRGIARVTKNGATMDVWFEIIRK